MLQYDLTVGDIYNDDLDAAYSIGISTKIISLATELEWVKYYKPRLTPLIVRF